MLTTTRTLGPLHFEDLEPKRFEDLVRQLAYDFRQWRVLEPTGRAGSDDGFDARGFEIVGGVVASDDDAESDEIPVIEGNDRQWLIQCKREKTITPSLLKKHLDLISSDERSNLYGILFVAACDFSKTARDRFREWCIQNHISESYLWGKADIEDQLFQTKNDHLLFAYFGISLQIRQRGTITALRSKLAVKRKCERVFGKPREEHRKLVLLRDPTDNRYPYRPEDQEEAKLNPFRWKVAHFIEHHPNGLIIEHTSILAYISDDRSGWDCVDKHDDGTLSDNFDPWSDKPAHDPEDHKRWSFWINLAERNRAWFKKCEMIKYEDILDIDEHGDRMLEGPHIYIKRPRERFVFNIIEPANRFVSAVRPDPETRIKFFPDVFPELPDRPL